MGQLPANAITGGYKGKIYLVNSRGGKIFGRSVYRSVEEIPDPVELGIVTIPAAFVKELIPQFIKKKIRQMLLISSGFGETGEAGRRLEQELIQAAEKAVGGAQGRAKYIWKTRSCKSYGCFEL